jgi:hypothetical protein
LIVLATVHFQTIASFLSAFSGSRPFALNGPSGLDPATAAR